MLAALRRVLGRQVELDVLAANPAAGVRAPSADTSPAQFLTPAEADHLQLVADARSAGTLAVPGKRGPFLATGNPAIGPMVAMALATGLRLGELQAVVWGPAGVDLDARQVRVAGTRDRAGAIVATKSRQVRVVPLGEDVVARMRRYRMAAPDSADGQRVFPHSIERAWRQVRAAADLPTLRFHDLRHSAATFWLAAGLTVHAVADLLGHADAHLVLSLYGHALPAEHASAGQVLDAWRAAQRGA